MKRSKKEIHAWTARLILLLLIGPVLAFASEPTPGQAQSGSLLWRMQQGYTTATLMNTDVDMQISGLVARVSVRQEFHNEGSEWVEGIYVFPLPENSAVDRMRLHIGDRFIEGEIQEKEHAKKTYEQAKQAGKKASLVQQRRPNLFTTSVANVAPGERVVVEIEYLEDIRYENGRFSIRFPMASLVTPPMAVNSRGHKLTLKADVNAGVPLATVASRYHPVSVAENNGHYRVTLSAGQVDMDHDFELHWQPVPSAAPRAMVFTETIEGQPYHLLMVMPPDQDEAPPVMMPREMILIIDTSGSMHGVSIAEAKRAVHLALKSLQANDRFNVIEFNSSTKALYPSSVAASPSNIASALNFVQQLQANGGTEMRPALNIALSSKAQETHLRQVVFVTDGSVGYEDEMFSMIEEKLGNARLFTVGIGSAPNSWFMRKAAEAGRGSYTFISALHEVREKMEGLFRKLEHPQVTDITVHWPSSVAVDSYPQTIPDLYLGEPVTVKTRASGEFQASDTVRISGNFVTGGWSKTLSLQSAEQSEGVGALWARARIAELMETERRGGGAAELRAAIVETALAHHLVSKYTSLVAVDKTPVRPASDPLSSEQVPNLMPYGQSMNAIFGFPATATNAPMLRMTGAACLLVALLLFAALQVGGRAHHARPV